eukprot:362113-Chlamydomonas_euryale.AAC.3
MLSSVLRLSRAHIGIARSIPALAPRPADVATPSCDTRAAREALRRGSLLMSRFMLTRGQDLATVKCEGQCSRCGLCKSVCAHGVLPWPFNHAPMGVLK